MGKKILMKGNEVFAEAAIRAGCECYFGYPITPQTELVAYMAKNMHKQGKVFLQAESEIAAINMVYGAAGTGARVMTSSSSPGISLMSEGISYLAAAELPCLIIDVVRCGPGLGGILPSQSDYNQVTKGLGHGDFNIPVYAPATVQEISDLIYKGFDVADISRTPVMIIADGMLGQVMEAVELVDNYKPVVVDKSWCAGESRNKDKHNVINSLYLDVNELENLNLKLQDKYKEIKEQETKYEIYNLENDNDIILVAYGTTSRICKNAIRHAEEMGIKLALIRPITIWPFPIDPFEETISKTKFGYLAVEMSCGQMVNDIKQIVNKRSAVNFYGRTGGAVPTPMEIVNQVKKIMEELK